MCRVPRPSGHSNDHLSANVSDGNWPFLAERGAAHPVLTLRDNGASLIGHLQRSERSLIRPAFDTGLLNFSVFAFRVGHGLRLQFFRGPIQVNERPPGGKKQGCRSNQPS